MQTLTLKATMTTLKILSSLKSPPHPIKTLKRSSEMITTIRTEGKMKKTLHPIPTSQFRSRGKIIVASCRRFNSEVVSKIETWITTWLT